MQEKAVNRLGDRAALGLIRHMGAQIPSDPQELGRILNVIRMAYAAPKMISYDADRDPKATLLLLSYLDFLPLPGKSKAEVEQTRAYVLQQVRSYRADQEKVKNRQ